MIPNGLVPVNTHGQTLQNTIMPWQTGSHPEISNIKEEVLRQSILQTFYVQHILRLMEIEKMPRETTLGAYMNSLNLLYGLLGPIYGALESEMIRPRVENDFFRLYRENVFSPPPDILLQDDQEINFEFQNPLSRAQRTGELEAIDGALLRLSQLTEFELKVKGFAESYDWLNLDEIAQLIMDVQGVPAIGVNSLAQVMKIREARTAQQQAQIAQQQLMVGAEVAGKSAPVLKLLAEQAQGNA